MPEDNGKQNSESKIQFYTRKYQKHITSNYDYKLVFIDDKFSKPFKIYLGKDTVYNFLHSMIEESKYCREVMKKHFNKEFVITKEDSEDFKNSTNSWICDNDYIDNDVKVRYHCHITGNYRGSVHRDYNINLKLNHKVPVAFHNLKNYDSHLIMEEVDKFNLEINVTPNGLEKYMSFTINNKLSFINSFQFLSASLDSLVRSLNKDNLKYLSQGFDNDVLDLVQQKGFYAYEYMSDFKKFKEELPSIETFDSLLTDRKFSDKEYEHVLNVWKKIK